MAAIKPAPNDVVITGIGLVTSMGVGAQANWEAAAGGAAPVFDSETFKPYVVHPLPEIDWNDQIPKRGDQRQMETWQRIGTYVAGLALDDAGMKDNPDLTSTMDMIVAAAGGERDVDVDTMILAGAKQTDNRDVLINEKLTTELRPTLFLAQLSNLLAGNISIVHKVTGSSRTFMGEEGAGISAVQVAAARIRSGQSTHALVGGAYNSQHPDMLLGYELGHFLARDGWSPVWQRETAHGGGVIPGSGGAFLVLESRAHAEQRGARIYAVLGEVHADMGDNDEGATRKRISAISDAVGLDSADMLVSSASGARDRLVVEKDLLTRDLAKVPVRGVTSLTGHLREAQFPASVAFAALSVHYGKPLAQIDSRFESPTSVKPSSAGVLTMGFDFAEGATLLHANAGSTPMTQRFTDHVGRPIIAITGSGVVSSLGKGKKDNWEKLTAGQSGIHRISRFPVNHLKTSIGGTVDFMTDPEAGSTALTYALAEAAALEAIEEAGLEIGKFGGPLFLAAPPVELEWNQRFALDAAGEGSEPGYDRILSAARSGTYPSYFATARFGTTAIRLRSRIGATGLPVTLSTACASGATAIQLGVEALRRGEADRVISVGTDGSVTAEALIRFSLLSALSTHNDLPEKASKPFSKDRDGFVMAEGAGALVMEPLEKAVARGATILGILEGCGECADDFHRTRSKPDGSPAIAAVRAALADAGVSTTDVGYINAHGTSTPENDKMECGSLATIFGERLGGIPMSSNKSMIGHTLTAAGAVEAVFSLMSIRTGILPPTINHDVPDPLIDIDVVPNTARQQQVSRVLSNSFGFGGQNTCLVIAAQDA